MPAQLKGELDLEFGKFRAKLAQAVNESARAQDRMKAGGTDLGDKMFGGMKNLGALAGVGSLGAAAVMFKDIVGHFDDVAEGAIKLGTSTDSFQRVSFAASQLATEIGAVGGAVLKAEKNLGDLDKSGGREALMRLGLDAEKFLNLPLEQKIIALAEAYNAAEGDAGRMATMQQILGKGATDLNVLFAEGKDGLEAMFANAPVAADETVQALAAVNDQLDAMKPKWQVFAGKWLSGAAMLAEITSTMIANPSKTLGQAIDEQAAEMNEAMDKAEARRSARKSLNANDGEKEDAKAQKKAADDSAKQAERIEKLKSETSRQSINELPDYQKYQALGELQDKIFEKMQNSGGMFFDPSMEGLQQWSEAALGRGQFDTAEKALGMLKEARDLQKEMDALNAKVKADTDKEARAKDSVNREKKRKELEDERRSIGEAPDSKAPIGSLAGAVARITGGDPTAMASLESARARERKLADIDRKLQTLIDQGKGNNRTAPGGVFAEDF